ncbi:NUDIX domain-containing protein [Litorisediminicola beolgyonensis]|uniref:NUDIX domain-containing protein n=1 Tax=Litorisediminicola beolgyonensis TaxID=1173614 RepID=A0ABW3ZFB8_9RHOB
MSEPTLAALAVVIRDGAVLLVRRSNRPDAGLWGFPGGKCEPGETGSACALRELHEETGITARDPRRIGAVEVIREGFHYDLEAFFCADPTGIARAADDAEEAAWVPVRTVISGAVLMSRDVDRLCLRAAHLAGL